jgi:hypothetical protein
MVQRLETIAKTVLTPAKTAETELKTTPTQLPEAESAVEQLPIETSPHGFTAISLNTPQLVSTSCN